MKNLKPILALICILAMTAQLIAQMKTSAGITVQPRRASASNINPTAPAQQHRVAPTPQQQREAVVANHEKARQNAATATAGAEKPKLTWAPKSTGQGHQQTGAPNRQIAGTNGDKHLQGATSSGRSTASGPVAAPLHVAAQPSTATMTPEQQRLKNERDARVKNEPLGRAPQNTGSHPMGK